MALLRSIAGIDAHTIIYADAVYLRFPQMADFEQWSKLREESRTFLEPWEPTWPRDDLTRGAFRRRLKRYSSDIRVGLAYPFFIFRESDESLVGGVTISNIRRGVTQSCSLGYWLGERFAKQGYMYDSVCAIIDFIFEDMNLHRIEAATLPENKPSQGVLKKTGFSQEGYARQYLKINGVWKDHVLFAIVKGDNIGNLRE